MLFFAIGVILFLYKLLDCCFGQRDDADPGIQAREPRTRKTASALRVHDLAGLCVISVLVTSTTRSSGARSPRRKNISRTPDIKPTAPPISNMLPPRILQSSKKNRR